MTFEVEAEGYDRFMGRYSTQLAPQLAEFAGVRPASEYSTWAAGRAR